MVVVALTGNSEITPPEIAKYSEKNDYFVEGLGTRWLLIPKGSEHYDLRVSELPLVEKRLYQTLDEGGKIICAMGREILLPKGIILNCMGMTKRGFKYMTLTR